MREYIKQVKIVSIAALVCVPLGACSTSRSVVGSGDTVSVSFSCRLPNGELAVTTRSEADVAGERKSPLYLQRIGPETLEITAAEVPRRNGIEGIKDFELVVLDLLAPKTAGMPVGEKRTLVLDAPRYEGLPKNEESASIPRSRHYKKIITMTPGEYAAVAGHSAEIGQTYFVDPVIPGTVSEVTDKEVVIRTSAKVGDIVSTPFGTGKIQENETEYFFDIEAVKGTLVRSDTMVGRVVNGSDKTIDLDYGHPFGGESLLCDVSVTSIEKRALPTTPLPVAVVPATGTEAASAADNESVVREILTNALTNKQKEGASIENFDAEFAARTVGSLEKSASPAPAQSALSAEKGDLATVDYQAMFEDGTLFLTTRKEISENPARKKVSWYIAAKSYMPEVVTAGASSLLPGVGKAVVGMKPGETKHLVLAPEQAFGQADPQKRVEFPVTISLPNKVTSPTTEFVKRTGTQPALGQVFPLTPYFPAQVTAIHDDTVEMEFQAEDGKTFTEPFGTTTVRKTENDITTTLSPKIGSLFPLQEGNGIITASDGKTFTVDQNHPLAGKTIVIDLTLAGLTKAADIPAGDLPWQEDHDAALSAAKKEGKPALLVLHADWCSFCKKLFSETMPDPRIKSLRDRFTWIKVNSDKLTEYKMKYGQEGYPMIVLFKSDGSIAQKLDGYLDASQLRAALQEVL